MLHIEASPHNSTPAYGKATCRNSNPSFSNHTPTNLDSTQLNVNPAALHGNPAGTDGQPGVHHSHTATKVTPAADVHAACDSHTHSVTAVDSQPTACDVHAARIHLHPALHDCQTTVCDSHSTADSCATSGENSTVLGDSERADARGIHYTDGIHDAD